MSTTVLVFAKAPQPGLVKTRLIPFLSAQQATNLHRAMIYHTVNAAINSNANDVRLMCSPHTHYPIFLDLKRSFGIQLGTQKGIDLGDKMSNAIKRAFQNYSQIAVIGTDCPGITSEVINKSLMQLDRGNSAAIHPTEDGGYALIALKKFSEVLFENISWSSASVMRETKSKLETLFWEWIELQVLWDVDRPTDFVRLRRSKYRRLTDGLSRKKYSIKTDSSQL